MTLLQMELSQLEAEPLEILVNSPTPEQSSDLETLISGKAEVDLFVDTSSANANPPNGYYSCNTCSCCGSCG